jgi:outer membrane usher protein FimD/PapC
VSTAGSFSLARDDVFADSDQLRLTVAQPLHATGAITLATDTAPIRLGPSGRETAVEMDYLRPFGPGSLSLAAFWRQQPGNIAASPDDAGVAARLHWRF